MGHWKAALSITDGASAYVDIAMAYNPVRNEFLLVWEDEYPTTDIYGLIVVMSVEPPAWRRLS